MTYQLLTSFFLHLFNEKLNKMVLIKKEKELFYLLHPNMFYNIYVTILLILNCINSLETVSSLSKRYCEYFQSIQFVCNFFIKEMYFIQDTKLKRTCEKQTTMVLMIRKHQSGQHAITLKNFDLCRNLCVLMDQFSVSTSLLVLCLFIN